MRNGRVVDSHQHFWNPRLGEYPWMTGHLASLGRVYEPDDLAPLLDASGVDGTIVVQARHALAETDYLLSKAIVASLLGLRYEVSFGGSTLFNYAADVAHALVKAVLTDPGGAEVFNLNGIRTSIPEFIDGIEMVVEGATGLLTFRPEPLQFPDDVDTSGLELLGPPPVIPLLEGIRQSVDVYRAAQRGRRFRPIDHGLKVIGDEAVDAPPTPSAG